MSDHMAHNSPRKDSWQPPNVQTEKPAANDTVDTAPDFIDLSQMWKLMQPKRGPFGSNSNSPRDAFLDDKPDESPEEREYWELMYTPRSQVPDVGIRLAERRRRHGFPRGTYGELERLLRTFNVCLRNSEADITGQIAEAANDLVDGVKAYVRRRSTTHPLDYDDRALDLDLPLADSEGSNDEATGFETPGDHQECPTSDNSEGSNKKKTSLDAPEEHQKYPFRNIPAGSNDKKMSLASPDDHQECPNSDNSGGSREKASLRVPDSHQERPSLDDLQGSTVGETSLDIPSDH